MPWKNRYIGNPVLSGIGRLFFNCPVGDFHCGLRGFSRAAFERMNLRTTGMEFASEMVIKATLMKMSIREVPTTLTPDGRSRSPHLRPYRDGWRHLRFMLLFSPNWLFLYPGFVLFVAGLLAMAWLLPESRTIGRITFDVHSLLYASTFVVVGFQSMSFWSFAKTYGAREGVVPREPWFDKLRTIMTLEMGVLLGLGLLVTGIGLGVFALGHWETRGFGNLAPETELRLVIPSSTAIILGFQIAYSAFFMSILEIQADKT